MNGSAWTDVGGGVHTRRSLAFAMNSVALLDPEHSVLVDPGVLPSELDDLAARVAEVRPGALTVVFTHGHWDHVLGRPWWPQARTIAHDRLAAEIHRERERIASEAQQIAERHGERWERGFVPFRPDLAVSGLHFTRLGPWRLVLRDAPGHSESQLSVHLPDRRVLIAADMLSDIEIPSLDGPAGPYRRTLDGLSPLAEGGAIDVLIPGHGSLGRGKAAVLERLERDRDYLRRLEAAVADGLGAGLPVEATQQRLSDLEYGGRKIDHAELEQHQTNVALTYRGLQAGSRPRQRRR